MAGPARRPARGCWRRPAPAGSRRRRACRPPVPPGRPGRAGRSNRRRGARRADRPAGRCRAAGRPRPAAPEPPRRRAGARRARRFRAPAGIAEAAVGGVHGDALRRAPRLGLEQMVEYAARRLGLAAQGLQTALFVGVQPGQPADAGLGVDQAARQAREMAGDAPQSVVLGIAQSQADAAVRRQHQGQPAGAARRRPRRQHLDAQRPARATRSWPSAESCRRASSSSSASRALRSADDSSAR